MPIPMASLSETIDTPFASSRSVTIRTPRAAIAIAATKRHVGGSPYTVIASTPMTTGRVPTITAAFAAEVYDRPKISSTIYATLPAPA
jgi:hypothetical protein